MARKKYLERKLRYLLQEKSSLSHYVRHHKLGPDYADCLLEDASGYAELLCPYFTTSHNHLSEWSSASFETNPLHPEQLLHKAPCNIFVRSKSEAMIARLLYTNGIPFRYECALSLGDTTIYPDFTVKHPITGQIYYWEHFGLMDDPSYSKNAISKLYLFISQGILPGIHLITTYETKTSPLDYETIEKIIKIYFL